jgi:ATP-dependent RNA helicase UAP56/SUB2
MSAHDNEDLIDYEDEHEVIPGGIAASATNGAPSAVDGDDKDKKNFSGIHSTGFRCFTHFALVFALAEYVVFSIKGLPTQT